MTILSAAPPQKAGSFALAVLASGLMMSSASIPSPFYHVLQQQMGFSALTMTAIFAIYALALLATLLTAGSCSDYIGRRPVISLGFVLLGLSAAIFNQAGSAEMLFVARALQGAACALLISTFSALTVDLEPAGRPGLAAICNSTVPMSGLAVGALLSGVVMDYVTDPKEAVFNGMTLASFALAALIWRLPETSPRLSGFARALRPSIGLPASARAVFWRSASATVASWAAIGLFLSLGASMTAAFFGVTSYALQAAAVTLVAGAGSATCYAAQRQDPRAIVLYGTGMLALGTLLLLGAIEAASVLLYGLALLCTGSGFGAALFGILKTIVPLTPPQQRGELFATIYVISYSAMGVPVVLSGLVMGQIGLQATVMIYGGAIILLSLIAGGFYLRR